ncbi:hypothetical protein DFQ28_003478 [Apophysomyces sp. BC1034]|nr:hypothetical protein DFQ30_003338 [Apophysomyces sp. BC1015]KAG0176339.1 hypothetical protein DFQ29_006264 [Apophysomyces sp. BC1021]KAG0189396.1 hypothetical protein DFQ28_003478 [Apophysomyces sp. BC1034]
MSTASSESDYIPDYRTSNARFQQKLLAAQQSATDRQIEDDFDLLDAFELPDSEQQLEEERVALMSQVESIEGEVDTLRQELDRRRARRLREATISKMTPEERAKAVEEEEQIEDEDVDNLDVLFDYLLYVGGAPLPSNAADMSGSNMITPHAELRDKARNNPEVQRQSEFTLIKFTQTDNRLVSDNNRAGEIRECELSGTCFDQSFHLAFEVSGPNYTVSSLTFDLSIVMQLETASILQQIKDECDLLAFFRLLVHYARLDDQRKNIFNDLKNWAAKNELYVEAMAEDRLRFQKDAHTGPSIVLSWTTIVQDTDKEDVGVNICERVLPDIQMQLDSCMYPSAIFALLTA